MTRPLAPSWLPRQQRRTIDSQLRKLFCSDNCSVCGSPFKHNSQTAGGLDAHGKVVLAGECCVGKVAVTFTKGLYSKRNYDFLESQGPKPATCAVTCEQITEALGLYQNAISEADKIGDGVLRHGGDVPFTPRIALLDHPWKDDDREWFKRNPNRSHRARKPFPGEADMQGLAAPAGHELLLLLRQTEPGSRMKVGFYFNVGVLPLPDDEATIHALFEVVAGREPMPTDGTALDALIMKYTLEPKQ